MRALWLAIAFSIAACSARDEASQHESRVQLSDAELEDAAAFPAAPTTPPQSWPVRQMSERRSVEYVARLRQENPVGGSHLYERRRSGNWIASTWREEGSTRQRTSYFNVRTGATVEFGRDATGKVTGFSIEQRDDYRDDMREPTGERETFLGEPCAVWRALPDGSGYQSQKESCVTDDGIELWSQTRHTGHPSHPDYVSNRVEVSSLVRRRVDPNTTSPPREVFEWAYWRSNAVGGNPATANDTPPDHTIWYADENGGRVIRARYNQNMREELFSQRSRVVETHNYSLNAPRFQLESTITSGRTVRRELRVTLWNSDLRWRPNPAYVRRNPQYRVILNRKCYWLDARNPPEDGGSSQCWTDDNFVLARGSWYRGSGWSATAVRLDTRAPQEQLEPPEALFDWAREVTS